MTLFRWLFSTILIVFVIIFAVSNTQEVSFNYNPLGTPLKTSLALITLSAAGIGLLGGGIIVWFAYGPLSRRAAQTRTKVRALKQEISRGAPKKTSSTVPALGGRK